MLGGTFAPIHYGHLRLATEARDQLQLDEVRLIPAGQPPLRAAPRIPGARRLRWVELAIAGERGLVADTRELRRSGPSYSVDTLAELRAEHPQSPLCLLLGDDKMPQFPQWRRWRELFGLAHVVIFNRPGAVAAEPPELTAELAPRWARAAAQLRMQPAGLAFRCRMPPVEISGSAIRARLKQGLSVHGLVPDAVIKDFTKSDLEAFAAQ